MNVQLMTEDVLREWIDALDLRLTDVYQAATNYSQWVGLRRKGHCPLDSAGVHGGRCRQRHHQARVRGGVRLPTQAAGTGADDVV